MESSSESDKPRRSVLHSISSDEPKFQLRTSLSVSEGHTSGSTEPQIRNSHLQIIRTMSNAMQSDKSAENSGDSSIRYIRTTSQQGSFSGKPGEQQNQVGKVKLKSIDKQKRGASEQWQGKSTVQGILSNGPRQGEQLQVGIDDAAVNENSMERKSRARQPKKSILSSSTRRTSLTQHHDRHGTNSQGRTSGEEYLSARFASTPHLQQGRQWRPSASPEGDEDDEPDFLLMAVVEHERQQEEYSSDDSALDSGDEEAPNATGTNGEKAENTAEKSKKRTTRLLSRRELAAVRYSLACLTMFFLYPGCSIFLCSLQTPAGIANQSIHNVGIILSGIGSTFLVILLVLMIHNAVQTRRTFLRRKQQQEQEDRLMAEQAKEEDNKKKSSKQEASPSVSQRPTDSPVARDDNNPRNGSWSVNTARNASRRNDEVHQRSSSLTPLDNEAINEDSDSGRKNSSITTT